MTTATAPTATDLQAEIDRLRAENTRLSATATATRRTTIRTSEKGGVSVYGMGRFPITLYVEQWETLFAMVDDIKAHIAANRDSLKLKSAS